MADSRTNLITSWSAQSQITWLAGNSTRLRRIFKQIFKSVIWNSSVAAAVQLVANVILCHIVKPFMSDQLPTPNFKPLSNAFNYILYNQNFTLPKLLKWQFISIIVDFHSECFWFVYRTVTPLTWPLWISLPSVDIVATILHQIEWSPTNPQAIIKMSKAGKCTA